MTHNRITSIEPQKKYPNRRNVYLDDAFAFGLDEEVVLKHHLHPGDEISEEMIQNILMEEEITRAKKKALSLLSYRARSIEEIRERLSQKGYDENIIDTIIEDFLRVGLLNDDSFASAYVQTRMIQKPMSKRMLIQELKQKGVEALLAVRAVQEGYGEKSEFEVARALIESKLIRYRHDNLMKIRKKISDFLTRRGFDWEIVSEVIKWKEMFNEEE
ncbi:regulatory protein RecX [bacterium]